MLTYQWIATYLLQSRDMLLNKQFEQIAGGTILYWNSQKNACFFPYFSVCLQLSVEYFWRHICFGLYCYPKHKLCPTIHTATQNRNGMEEVYLLHVKHLSNVWYNVQPQNFSHSDTHTHFMQSQTLIQLTNAHTDINIHKTWLLFVNLHQTLYL